MMETFALYLVKSVVWISGFTLIFVLFLRDERFFMLKRLYLLSGILASMLLPLLTVHYYIELPATDIQAGNPEVAAIRVAKEGIRLNFATILFSLYGAGVIIIALRMIMQGGKVIKSIKMSEITTTSPVKLIRTASFTSSFSFFSWVFVNPSVSDVETREIMNHEMVHIRQKHWADLFLAELLCILQWFNPLTWLYLHFIRQNHEYLADEGALQRSSDPSVYRAVLLNQIVGSPVISLSNFFSYSLTKKRFNMMKNIVASPYRKMKLLLILPVLAGILFAFAKPEYRLPAGNNDQPADLQQKAVKGIVMQQNGTPLQGASVIAKGTTIGTATDSKGNFMLAEFPGDAPLVISYVGFTGKAVKPNYDELMKIIMIKDTLSVGSAMQAPPPPPPPPPVMNDNGNPPLIVIDGKINQKSIKDIDPNTIESVNVLKDKPALDKYGEKGKNGVFEVTLKKPDWKPKEGVYVVVEELPQFSVDGKSPDAWIASHIKYPAEAAKKGITGQVLVVFEVTEAGTVANAKVEKPVNPLLDAEAVRVISSMPAWKPGYQNGKPVNVIMKILVVFKLN